MVPALCCITITTILRHGSFAVYSPFAPLGPFSTFCYPILCPGCQPLQMSSSSAYAVWLLSASQSRMSMKSGHLFFHLCLLGPWASFLSVTPAPGQRPFPKATTLSEASSNCSPPYPFRYGSCFTSPKMFFHALLSALTFAYTLVISPSLNSLSYFEYAVNFLDSEQYRTTISLF